MSRKEVGERIKSLRKLRNMTRDEVANKSEISSKFLYEIELGKKGLSADTLVKIANTLSCSCDYIMTGEQEDNKENKEVLLDKFEEEQRQRVREIMGIIEELCVDRREESGEC